jgi:hypothetical protein
MIYPIPLLSTTTYVGVISVILPVINSYIGFTVGLYSGLAG